MADTYLDRVYEIVKEEAANVDAVYESFIVLIVGRYGLDALLEAKLLETCGFTNGGQLYAIVEKGNEK